MSATALLGAGWTQNDRGDWLTPNGQCRHSYAVAMMRHRGGDDLSLPVIVPELPDKYRARKPGLAHGGTHMPKKARRDRPTVSKMPQVSRERILEVWALREAGMSYAKIARKLGQHVASVHRIGGMIPDRA